VTFRTGHTGYTFRFCKRGVWMPWKASSVMDERLRFVARLLDGEAMTEMCREFGISRKTGYKIFDRYREHGLAALSDRSRRPVRYANQLPVQIESLIVRLKAEKPHWGARKIRELLVRRLDGISECRPRAPSMRCSIVTAWSGAAAGRAIVRAARRCRRAPRPTSCGAPTSRASSSSATAAAAVPRAWPAACHSFRQRGAFRQSQCLVQPLKALGLVAPARHRDRTHQAGSSATKRPA
jgi:transposase